MTSENHAFSMFLLPPLLSQTHFMVQDMHFLPNAKAKQTWPNTIMPLETFGAAGIVFSWLCSRRPRTWNKGWRSVRTCVRSPRQLDPTWWKALLQRCPCVLVASCSSRLDSTCLDYLGMWYQAMCQREFDSGFLWIGPLIADSLFEVKLVDLDERSTNS